MGAIVEDYKKSSKEEEVQFKDQKFLWKKKTRSIGRKAIFKEERQKILNLKNRAQATVRKELHGLS